MNWQGIAQRYLVVIFAFAAVLVLNLQGLPNESSLYQLLTRHQVLQTDEVIIVAIDENTQRALGSLPFAHSVYDKVLSRLQKAQLIVNTLNWDRLENSEVLKQLQQLQQHYQSLAPAPTFNADCIDPNSDAALLSLNPDGSYKPPKTQADLDWDHLLTQVQTQFNHSRQLATQLDKVVLAIHAQLSQTEQAAPAIDQALFGFEHQQLSTRIHQQRFVHVISNFSEQNQAPRFVKALQLPHNDFIDHAKAIGWLPAGLAADNLDFPLVVQYQARYYPSLALLIHVLLQQQTLSDVLITLGKYVQIGQQKIITDSQLQARSTLAEVQAPEISFIDVYRGEIPPEVFADKWVLLGQTATPMHHSREFQPLSQLQTLNKQVLSLGQQQLAQHAPWSRGLDYALLCLYALFFLYIAPLLKNWVTLVVVLLLSALQLGTMASVLWWQQQWWALPISLSYLGLGLVLFLLQQSYQTYLHSGRQKTHNTENKRMMGLTYQSQGKLELAFTQLRQCPMDERLLSLLYNLAMDFEQRKQTAGAVGVYQHIQLQHPDYRDIQQRLLRLQHALNQQDSQTLHPKAHNKKELNQWLDSDSMSHKPLLGHFQIEKRLGKGAMGVLYLGKDRKFDRMVALKTIALSDEFEGKELQEATARFFREAEAAARLNHEHIINVYHAGEANQMAYIAMEFFKGSNLIPYTNPDNLLELNKLLEIIIKITRALAYAHEQGVVHRDVKPGNIMYNPGTSFLKLTDFGIARITDQHKTRTGVILGTPSYMAPEQLAGNNVDGRADLFSLGVMLYQLLTGQLPFKADSMASLMFQIAHGNPANILDLRPNLPNCLRILVNTLLEKQPERRYSSGQALLKALESCKQQIDHKENTPPEKA